MLGAAKIKPRGRAILHFLVGPGLQNIVGLCPWTLFCNSHNRINMDKPLNERHVIILEQLMDGVSGVQEIAKITQVSEITIRRDFVELEKMGFIKRIYGGAKIISGRSTVVPFTLRKLRNREVKNKLAAYAATMISDGECIAFDSGTTILEMTGFMQEFNSLTVLTTSIFNAVELIKNPNIKVVLPGGMLEGMEGALRGELPITALQDFFVDKFFLCVGAIDSVSGLTEHDPEDAQVKSIIISKAKETILVVDSSKFECTAFKKVCSFECITKLITDMRPPEPLLNQLKSAGTEIHVILDGNIDII